MSQIDWSKAPEGTTHFDQGSESRISGWMRLRDGKWYWWPAPEAKCARDWHLTLSRQPVELFIERPAQWTGEGLPPVGTVCEYRLLPSNQWHECEIRYRMTPAHDDESRAIVWNADLKFDQISGSNWEFRPTRTPEQIERDQIDSEAEKLFRVINPSGKWHKADTEIRQRYLAAIMLGYRKFEIVENEE